MYPSPPSQQLTPITTSDELHTRSIKSPLHTSPNPSTEQATRPQSSPPSSPSQLSASPTPHTAPSRHSVVSTSTSMSATQSQVQSNSAPQDLSETFVLINSNSSRLILPEPTASLRRDRPAGASSQPLDFGIIDPVSLHTISRQHVTPSFSFSGTSSSATTNDCVCSESSGSQFQTTTSISSESISPASQRTPNVYINGLPPHCSEQDLFALARPFGDIKSVRTFTRHVSEKPTGYGFVLFGDVDSAQGCIEGLRKFHNLHPSFSKQVHRIPGTEYAQHCAAQYADVDENSFKSRMEKLKDNASTNLYIEGLPLSTDEESLTALIKPYKIKSSRLFKTKLSNPPRIIAFVRLETRTAAEETIERLHGRMVRGWNDPGCRISVRFADSAEQRELRRTERSLKNGDQSPSRLTIAQASLLNLRGQQFQANIRDAIATKSLRPVDSQMDNQATFSQNPDSVFLPVSRSMPSKLCYTSRESPLSSTPDLPPIPPRMDGLLQSMQSVSYDDGLLDSTMRSLALDNEYLISQRARLRALASATLLSPNTLPVTLPRGHTQARNGFTPAEELILEAHAQRLQLQAQSPPSPSIIEPAPSLGRIHGSSELANVSGLVGVGMFTQDTEPTISEDTFHAMNHQSHSFTPTSHNFREQAYNCPPTIATTSGTIFVRPPSRAISIVPPPPDYEEPGKRSNGPHQRTIGPKQNPYPSSSSHNRQSISSGESRSHPSFLQTSTHPNNINSNNNVDDITSAIPCNRNIKPQPNYMYSHGDARSCPEDNKGLRFRPSHVSQIYAKKSPQLDEQISAIKEGGKTPAVVSPALTYSSRTPSTLSPATPFFGSFVGSQDTFEVMTMENEDMAERKLKARIANK